MALRPWLLNIGADRRGSAQLESTEGLIDRRTLLGEEFWSLLSYIQTVFQTNSELAIDHDRWFVAKAHARLNRSFVSAHKVRPFVAVQTDAVTRAVRQTRHFIIGSEARVGDHFARGRVDGFAGRTDFSRQESGIL